MSDEDWRIIQESLTAVPMLSVAALSFGTSYFRNEFYVHDSIQVTISSKLITDLEEKVKEGLLMRDGPVEGLDTHYCLRIKRQEVRRVEDQ
jgi:hypothetical protein